MAGVLLWSRGCHRGTGQPSSSGRPRSLNGPQVILPLMSVRGHLLRRHIPFRHDREEKVKGSMGTPKM